MVVVVGSGGDGQKWQWAVVVVGSGGGQWWWWAVVMGRSGSGLWWWAVVFINAWLPAPCICSEFCIEKHTCHT